MAISFTKRAIDEIKAIISRDGIPPTEQILRIGVVGGGCAGFTYRMGFDDTIQEGDHIQEIEGFKLAVDPRSHLYLDGTEIDYRDSFFGRGFVFKNPNARYGCSCSCSAPLEDEDPSGPREQ